MKASFWGHFEGHPGLVRVASAEGGSPAELNRRAAAALRALAQRFEDAADLLDVGEAVPADIERERADEFMAIAARLRKEGLGDDAGTAG